MGLHLRIPRGFPRPRPLSCRSARAGFSFGRMNTAHHRAALLVLPLRALHSTNIGSGIDPINELEVGEDLPRCEPFDFLLAQAVKPIKKRTLLGGQLRRLFGARHGDWIMLSQRSVFPRRLPHLRARRIQARRHERAR
jgi:hypothetical protein